jgi:hypothetical protein
MVVSRLKTMKNSFFLKKSYYPCIFAGVLLLGSPISLTVVIRELNPNYNKRTSVSYTADFSTNTSDRKANVAPFERGTSKDYASIKIFSIGFIIVENEIKQHEVVG